MAELYRTNSKETDEQNKTNQKGQTASNRGAWRAAWMKTRDSDTIKQNGLFWLTTCNQVKGTKPTAKQKAAMHRIHRTLGG